MAVITNYGTLKTAVADWLNRSDLTDHIPNFVQNAEARFLRDPRVRDPDGGTTRITALSADGDTNWLLTDYPDVYVYGALVEAAPFLIEDERVGTWEGLLQQRLDELSGNVRTDPTRSLGVGDYAGIQRMVVDILNRGDMENVVPVMIVMAEKQLARDRRVRDLETTTFSITGDDLAVPSGFRTLESWYHDTDSYRGAIEIVGADQLGELKALWGPSGAPAYAAILNGSFRFAPAPDATYSTKMTYWQTLTALASGANWLSSAHPDIYVYATLVECAAWTKDDPTAWKIALEERVEAMHQETWDDQWSGTLRRQVPTIG